jgi:hypothetical protein
MTLTLTLHGETLGNVIDQMRFLLDTVETDEGRALLAAMHGEMPAAQRRAPLEHFISPEAIEASADGQASECSSDDVRAALKEYVSRFGEDAAVKHIPTIIGWNRISEVPPEKLWRARAAIHVAIQSGKPAGRNPRRG